MERFDIVIIGGGVGGLVTASAAAQLGAKVALIEKAELGGDCLHYGCVPTKRLVKSAKVAHTARRSEEFGIETGTVTVNFKEVMDGVRRVKDKLGEHDDPRRFEEMGIRVIIGSGSFVDSETFEVNGERVTGRRFLVATGSSPALPDIPGLNEANPLTNISILDLEELPGSMAVLGAGPIAIEYAQVFARLGTKVTVILRGDQILKKEDKELATALEEILVEEGVTVLKETGVVRVRTEGSKKVLHLKAPGGESTLVVSEILAALGQSPNVSGLGLSKAGVEYDLKKGIRVNDKMETNVKHIFSCGDVAGEYKFTHVAEYQAGIVITNALFPLLKRHADYGVVPWVTFTGPELARVGLTEAEAADKYGADGMKVYRFSFKDLDRAVIDGEARGLVKLVVDNRKHILGAHILGPNAGELIHEYVLALNAKIPITKISQTIHVYPTMSQAVKRAADEYYREKFFKGWVPKVAKRFAHRTGD